MRLEGGRLAAHLEEALPDYRFAFEGSAGEVRSGCAGVAAMLRRHYAARAACGVGASACPLGHLGVP